jgi:predicted nucleotidyltransferase
MVNIITIREKEIIEKKLRGIQLTQNESNILSKYIRPKLKEISRIDSEEILKKIEYNQKARPLENKIKKIILKHIPNVASIIICGSAIQSNYQKYNDIDLIVAVKKPINKEEKRKILNNIEIVEKQECINLDIQIYSKDAIISQYPHNPSLIYQLKDSKIIYGKLDIPKKISLSPLDLRMKLDWSEADNNSKPEEIYYAIRNSLLVLLLMHKKVDNYELKNNMINSLGENIIEKLRNNLVSKSEKKLALSYLKMLVYSLESELKNAKWEKIEIENP